MDIEKVKDALESAEYFFESEIQNVEYEELRLEYLEILNKIKFAITEIDKN